jgi:hypothetical protein
MRLGLPPAPQPRGRLCHIGPHSEGRLCHIKPHSEGRLCHIGTKLLLTSFGNSPTRSQRAVPTVLGEPYTINTHQDGYESWFYSRAAFCMVD